MSFHYSYLSEEYKSHWRRMNPDAVDVPEKQIPAEMVSALTAAKGVNSGISAARQVALSLFDMRVHNPSSHEELEEMDIGKDYHGSITEATGMQGPEDGTLMGNGHSTTSHFMWGQEANYYSYVSYVAVVCLLYFRNLYLLTMAVGLVCLQQICGRPVLPTTP